MAQIIINCPQCGETLKVATWGKNSKNIQCSHCGSIVDVKQLRMNSVECPFCGTISLCKKKAEQVKCPGCKKTFKPTETVEDALKRRISLNCPNCNCHISLRLEEQQTHAICPICKTDIDVVKEVAKESQYDSQKISVIQYTGDPSVLVYRHPIEKINMGSQLIVGHSQEAIFVHGGQALDLFGPGTHTLNTENLPVLSKVNEIPINGDTPFPSKIYFFNKAKITGIQWGYGGISYRDANIGNVPFNIGINGTLELEILDSRKLLLDFVGQEEELSTKDLFNPTIAELEKYNIDITRNPPKRLLWKKLEPIIKQNVSRLIMENHLDILTIENNLIGFGEILSKLVSREFEKYGLSLVDFIVSKIQLPENDENFQKYRQLINDRHEANITIERTKNEDAVDSATAAKELNRVRRQNEINIAGVSGEEMINGIRASSALSNRREEGMTDIEMEYARGIASADVERYKGIGDAQTMSEMGYDMKDVLHTTVDVARAEALGQVGSRVGGSGGIGGGVAGGGLGGVFGDMMVGAAVGKTLGRTLSKEINENFKDVEESEKATDKSIKGDKNDDSWECPKCHKKITSLFCGTCGTKKPEKWICSRCKTENITNFCIECGEKKPEKWKCKCGTENTGRFCGGCGTEKPTNEKENE